MPNLCFRKKTGMRFHGSLKNPVLIAIITTLLVMILIGWMFHRNVERIDQQIENIRHHDQ